MKIEIPLNKATRLINSGQVILVSSCYKDKANIITLAWNTPLTKEPPLLGISIARSHLSSELIEKSEEFIVNVPHFELLDKVVFCGSHSGRDQDKFKASKLTPAKAQRLVRTPLISECLGHLECYLRDIKQLNDHILFIGEIIYASAESELFNETWQVDKIKLIYHLGGTFFTTSHKLIETKI